MNLVEVGKKLRRNFQNISSRIQLLFFNFLEEESLLASTNFEW